MWDGFRMTGPTWSLEVFATDEGFEPFTAFLEGLGDTEAAALDAALEHVLAVGGLDLARGEWLKPLGEGLHEFRVRHTADEIRRQFADEPPELQPAPGEKVLLRVFVHFYGRRVILLLSGYDKGDDPSGRTQGREIKQARKFLKAWGRQEARRKKAARRKGGR